MKRVMRKEVKSKTVLFVLLIGISLILTPAGVRGQPPAAYVEEDHEMIQTMDDYPLISAFGDYEMGAFDYYDYYANFLRMAQWLITQQKANGGVQEAEDYSLTLTNNTAESIWTWSCYAQLTGDYTAYLQNINNAWGFCYANPSWEEGSSPTDYYTVYNVGWGLLAEMKYREVYEGRPEYIDHTWYGEQCANTLVNYTPGTVNTRSALCLGFATGALHQYGVSVSNSTYCLRAAKLGDKVRQWLEANPYRFGSESWVVSGGIAVWGVLNSYFQENPGEDVWAQEFAAYMPINAHDGLNNTYEYGHDGRYAWGHYAVSQALNSEYYFQNYRNIVDYLLSVDGDGDGGIPRGPTYTDNQDFAWVTNVAAFALNLGLLRAWPLADAGSDQSVSSGDVVWFNGSKSYSPNGTIVSYEWNFGDGETATGCNISHRFRGAMVNPETQEPRDKTYTVRLTVEDDKGDRATDTADVIVMPLEKCVPVSFGYASMRSSYNWIGLDEITGEDLYIISKITFSSAGIAGLYILSITREGPVLPIKRWEDIRIKSFDEVYTTPFIPSIGKVWGHWSPELIKEKTFPDGTFNGIEVRASDVMSIVVAGGVIKIPPVYFDTAATAFYPAAPIIPAHPVLKEVLMKMLQLFSPGELRVYDSQGRVTGLVGGEVKEEIPNSVYNKENKTILIFGPNDFYVYEVAGIDKGTYGLGACSVEEYGKTVSFTASDISTSPNAVHQYTADWEALSQGGAGVTLRIDADGDSVFERTIISDSRLTVCKVAIELITCELISQDKVSETEFEYIFRVLAKNSADRDVRDISFKLIGAPTSTSIIDDIVYFSIIEPGEDILSDDTAKVRSDKSFEALESELVWQICNCVQRSRSDFNRDWYVDLFDLAEFTDQWLQSCLDPNWCQGTDFDYSTAVDFTDFAIFAKDWFWKIIPADFDIDKDVDFLDYAILANHWMDENCVELAWCEGADLNKDGQVDFLDLGIFAEHWLEGVVP